MYPLTCVAGFNVPVRQGKYEIVGFTCAVGTPGAASHIAIVDDPGINPEWTTGRLLGDEIDPPTEIKGILVHKVANLTAVEATLEWHPQEPIKTRHGISIHTENIMQGSFCLYVR